MKWADRVLSWPPAYRLWMAPFAERKVAPIRRHLDLSSVGKVLDVGCGPGTNAPLFARADYVGIDVNPAYIASARQRHHGEFVVADVATYDFAGHAGFDAILVNSLLHHLDDRSTTRLLERLRELLTETGRIHILELVLPARPSLALALAKLDRGRFARPLAHWERLLNAVLTPTTIEPYAVRLGGLALWHMVYYAGRPR